MHATDMTIGDLARTGGVAVSTVRYYERLGLLRPRGRTAANYRVYDGDAAARLHFIRAAQANGFTLEDVAALFAFRDGRTSACRAVQDLIEGRLHDLADRMRQLQHVERVLRSSLRECRKSEREGRCVVIDTLSTEAKSARGDRPRKIPRNPA